MSERIDILNALIAYEYEYYSIHHWRLRKRHKYKRLIKYNRDWLYSLDIFALSILMGSFYSSVKQEALAEADITLSGYQTIFVIDNARVEFIPTRKMFLITDNDKNLTFEIYKNGRITKSIKPIWEDLVPKIKNFYLDSVRTIAREFYFSNDGERMENDYE